MGDITGRPKAPPQQVIYVPQYVYPDPAPSTGGGSATVDTPTVPTPSEQRERNLLGRSRSRIGTILTSFRGILSPAETDGQRKTLLGE